MKTTISAVDARRNFGRLLNVVELTHAELTIERAGKPIARLVGVEQAPTGNKGSGKLNIRSSRGLGQELWRSVDVPAYLAGERAEWD